MSEKTENKMIKNDDSNVNTVNVYSYENSQQINVKKNPSENPQENSHHENSRLENSTFENNPQEQTSNNNESCFSQKKTKIIIGIILGLIIAGIIILCVLLLKKEDNENENKIPPIEPENPFNPINPSIPDQKHIESEFAFKTEVKDLIGLNVKQKSTEKITTNGIESTINVNRETNYDIFILSEKDPNEENKNHFNKLYTAAILINSQCVSIKNESCTPKKMIDITKVKKDDIKNSLRYLDEIPDFKDLPVPLCLFNLTDNDVIMSMTCPEKLQTSIKQNMILDLYFFRPPAIKRPDKEGGNITLDKWEEGGKYYIREKNGGICDIPNAFNSFCTTEMNTSVNMNGTLLTYDEEAVTNIIRDDENSYYKIKTTNLYDKSEEYEKVDKESYEEVLNNIISKLNPYMVYKEEFSDEEFKVLYKLSKNLTTLDNENSKRNLNENEKKTFISDETLLNIQHYAGMKVIYKLRNDIGYNTESMRALSYLLIDDKQKEFSNFKQFTNLTKVINKLIILSKSGNELLLDLYNQINDRFEKITTTVSSNITNLINIVVYNDLSEIFDSTLSLENLMNLPISILAESTSLKSKLENLYNNIDAGGMKNNIKILNTNVYNYIQKSHILVDNIYKNINNLTQTLNSSRSKMTEISAFFTNNTPSSLVGTINEAEEILMNYYKTEKDLILKKINEPLKLFETKIKESLNKEEKLIDNLYSKLENDKINLENANEEDVRNLKLNIYNIKNYVNEIIKKGKEKILNELELKDSDYLISTLDINTNNNSYYEALVNAKTIATKLDHDDFIDKSFINTMDNYKNNYTNILKNMDLMKKENFPLIDDALNGGSFNEEVKKSFDLDNLGINVFNEIINENDKYLNDVHQTVQEFLNENKNYLDELYLKLSILFTDDYLKEIADDLENQFNIYFENIHQNIEKNKVLSNDYLLSMANIMNDNNLLLEYLKNVKHDDPRYPYVLIYNVHGNGDGHDVHLKNFVDSIKSKAISEGYLAKYSNFKNNIEDAKNYVLNELYSDLKNEYQKQLNEIKFSLHQIKNSKISDIFPDFSQLDFIENNINHMNEFYNKLNNHVSNEIFNDYFYNKIQEFINKEIEIINNIDSDIIEFNHNKVKDFKVKNDYQNDFCVNFIRKRTYTCSNGVIYAIYDTNYDDCFPLIPESNYDQNLTKISSNCRPKFSLLNKFYLELNSTIENYNSKIIKLRNKLLEIQNNVLKNNNVTEKLKLIKIKVENILNENYGENLITNSYEYFKQISNERIANIFNVLDNNFKDLFTSLKTEIQTNLDNYKYSISEFNFKAQILQQIYIKNISNDFYDSIISHQKMEFNYTISYYYNYLYKIINSTHQLILSKIPENKKGLDVIIKNRENSVNEIFSEIIQMLLNSKNSTLNLENQIYILQKPETNFFETNSILTNSQINLNNSLTNINREISNIKNDKTNDEFALTLKYYLENSENGKQINDFYEEINNQVFVYLNLEQFKETILNNWIFDQDDFIKKLNWTLYNSNLEISKEFYSQKETIQSKLFEIVSENFTNDEIIHIINNLFTTSYKNLEEDEINEIKLNIQEIVQKLKENLIKEQERIETFATSLNKDFTIINQTIENYKNNIFSTVNKTIFNVVDQIYNNINTKLYENYIEYYLNMFYQNVSQIINEYESSQLLNSSFNIKDIIFNIVDELTFKYKYISKYQINYKYKQIYENICNQIDLENIKNYINNEIDEQFDIFYSSLKNIAIYEIGIHGYKPYDLNDSIKNEINDILQNNNNNINEIIQNTKGENFDFDGRKWKKPDFSRINNKLTEIKENFDRFINKQKLNELNNIEEFVQQIIKSNFNNLLNNLIPSFGNDFFDRIIFYNENFKIEGLYDNLIWGLSETLSYYVILLNFNSIKSLTKDLKMKIYSLNNLDDVIKNKNNEIFELLNTKIDEFINESGTEIKEKYISFISNDTSIELAFDEKIMKLIKNNLNLMIPEILNDYNNLLNEYLKEKIFDSYKNVLNLKAEEIYVNIKNQREFVKTKFDDLFSLDPDEVLNEINIKLNNTQNSIKEYKNNFNSFEISKDLFNYVENYGKNYIKPLYENFLSFMNQITKNKIIDNIDKNSKNYENSYDKNSVLKYLNVVFNDLKNNYFNPMNNSIKNYGIDDYENNLIAKINNKTMRLLQTDDNLHSKKVADKSIDETFHKLLNNSNNVNNFIKNFEKFDDFETKIENSIEKLNSAYKYSKNLIISNAYEDEIEELILNKLEYLYELTSDYYIQINDKYYEIKNYLKTSIEKIDKLINLCANKTFSAFVKQYEEIAQESQNINEEKDESAPEFSFKEESLTQNTQFYININMKNLIKKANFKFEFNFDEINNLKMPKVYAHVINLSRPKKINMEIYNNLDQCSKRIESYEIEFNNVNFTLMLDFNTDSTDILTTVITDFDAYQYSVERYLIESSIPDDNCDENNPMIICPIFFECGIPVKVEELAKTYKTVEKIYYKTPVNIPN